MKRRIVIALEGTKTQQEPVLNETQAWEYLLPFWGTYRSILDAYNDPTATNIGMAVLSGIGDATGLGLGAKALKTASALSKLKKASTVAKPVTQLALKDDLFWNKYLMYPSFFAPHNINFTYRTNRFPSDK